MLTFVIPVYKTPLQLLRNCLDSVLRYTQPMELVCVLDSPGDPCEAVLAEYAEKDPRMRLLKNDRNCGVSYSRNRGMGEARGEYIAFVDADDEVLAEAYEHAVDFADESELDGCAVARNNLLNKAVGGVEYGGRLSGTMQDPVAGRALVGAFSWAVYPSVLRRSRLEAQKIRFAEGRRYGEDFVYITTVLCAGGRFGFLNENGYKSVGHEGSTCKAIADVDNYLQGLMSSTEVLQTAIAAKLPPTILAWYLVRTLQLSLLHRQSVRFVVRETRADYCRLLREYFGLVLRDVRDVASYAVIMLATIIRMCPRVWFLPGAPGATALKGLNHFNWMIR